MSLKKCEKKLREIQLLKTKKHLLTQEEVEKINKEEEYTHMCKKNSPIEKNYEGLPDELQNIILSFLDPNTRLKILRQKYTLKFVSKKLDSFPKTRETMKKMCKMTTLVKDILINVMDKNGQINTKTSYVLNCEGSYICSKKRSKYYAVGSIDTMTCAILGGIRNYTKMYQLIKDKKTHYKYEKMIIKLYAALVLL